MTTYLIRCILLLCIATVSVSQVMLSFNQLQNSLASTPRYIYLPSATIFISFSPELEGRCGSTASIEYITGPFTNTTDQFVVAEGPQATSIPVSVLWCVQHVPTSKYQATAYSAAHPPTVIGSVVDGVCQLDMDRVGPTSTGCIGLAVGLLHAATVIGGSLYSWGANDHCQLGALHSSTTPTESLVLYPWFSDFTGVIRANQNITCAQRENTDIVCWGAPVLPPAGTDCTTYQYARFGIASVVSFAVCDTFVAAINADGKLILAGLLTGIITSSTVNNDIASDYAHVASSGLSAYTAWSNYPTVAIPLFNDLLRVGPGIGNTFLLVSSTTTYIVGTTPCTADPTLTLIPHQPIDACVVLPYPVLSGIVLSSVVIYQQPDFSISRYAFSNVQNTVGAWDPELLASIQSTPPPTPAIFSAGASTVCWSTSSTATCIGTTYTPTSVVHRLPAAIVYEFYATDTDVYAGGAGICILANTSISCVGPSPVVQAQTHRTEFVPVIGPIAYITPFIFNEPASIFTSSYIVAGTGGCFSTVSARSMHGATSTFTAFVTPRRYQLGNACLELTSCVNTSWNIEYGPFPVCISKVVAGSFHTCILTCDGTVMCAGRSTECQYIPRNYSDFRVFNPIWTGAFAQAGDVFAANNITCAVSVSRTQLTCTGTLGVWQMCVRTQSITQQTVVSPDKITNVFIGYTSVCYSITSTTGITIRCIGTGALGIVPQSTGIEWATSLGSAGSPLLLPLASISLVFSPNTNDSTTLIIQSSINTMYVATLASPYFAKIDNVVDSLMSETLIGFAWAVIEESTPMMYFGIFGDNINTSRIVSYESLDKGSPPPYGMFTAISGDPYVQVCALNSFNTFFCVTPVSAYIPLVGANVVQVAAGADHVAVLTADNMLCIAGSNALGQCGRIPTNYSTSTFVCVSSRTTHWPYYIPELPPSINASLHNTTRPHYTDTTYIAVGAGVALSVLASMSLAYAWHSHIGYKRIEKDILIPP